jgi:CRISPR-associated protein Cas5h
MNGAKEFTVFDVESDLAHFRRPYTTTSALTFPIPPRTALCGLVGAILGLPKNDGLADLTDQNAIFGLLRAKPLDLSQYSFNLVDTKDNPSFRLKPENPHTQVRYECIRYPRYRIAFSHAAFAPKLTHMLLAGKSVYTPCLGLAWMIASVSGVLSEPGELITGPARTSYPCLVRTSDLEGEVEWAGDAVYQRLRMPAEMQPGRQVTRYEEYIVETTGQTITGRLRQHWRLAGGDCFSPM